MQKKQQFFRKYVVNYVVNILWIKKIRFHTEILLKTVKMTQLLKNAGC